MRSFPWLAIVVAGISGCTTLNRENTVPAAPRYEMENYRVASSPDCDENTACTNYEISYPVFSGIDSVAGAAIQRIIELSFSIGDPEADDKTLPQVANEFLENYKEFSSEIPDYGLGWFYHGEARVNVLKDTLISISVDEEYFTKNAHKNTGKYFINVDPRTGREYKLGEFFKPGFEADLNNVGEEIFRKERQLDDSATYQFNYFEFADNRFQLNGNFGFTNKRITFYFNNYEIAPYAAGPTEINIPFERIKGWLKREPAL